MDSLIRAELLFPKCYIKVEPEKDLFEYNFYSGGKYKAKISDVAKIAERWSNLRVVAAKNEYKKKKDYKRFEPVYDLLAEAIHGDLQHSELVELLRRICPESLG